ncbi:unnamed protein product [Coffea canephora]|uniref:Glycosyltransferase n=1 Tax=Coffea canephora TaxID=49390 RepID=A0A068UAJ3_COFCA|nr:unnamed protein product [Coffea canephora]
MEGTLRESNAPRFRILMFPWLAHGHISPFMELSKRLAKSNFQVYLCSTEINLNFMKRSAKFDENSSDHAIEFVQLDLPDLPELPPHYHTTKNIPPHLEPTLKRAFHMAKTNFQNILNNLKPDLLVYDGFQPWASELAALNHIPSVLFLVVGAVNLSFKILAKLQESKAKEGDALDVFKSIELSSDIVLVKSWRGIEGKYIDHLSSSCGKKLVAVGPLSNQEDNGKEADSYSLIIEFLNSKDEASVVYVSFGSEYFLSKEEREEIAVGLELSNANFIWVVRFPVGHAIGLEEALPEGFLERVKGRGMVVNGWAPQAKILGHRSTGGFVSHCGWGSVIESIYYGVPLLALPMHLDQPLHARLAVEIGVGIEILKDEDGQIKREEIARVINEVVVKKTEGKLQGQKAIELSKKLREEGEEELHEAIEKLRSLCSKNK